MLSESEFCALIDHAVLKPNAPEADVLRACREAREYGFASVCVLPYWIQTVVGELASCGVQAAAPIGFPFGGQTTRARLAELRAAIEDGAGELDIVMNLTAFKSGRYAEVEEDLRALVAEANAGTKPLLTKVIIETAYLDDDEKRRASEVVVQAGADYVKTSTGFGPAGATVADVRLIREVVGSATGIKAAGGIRTLTDALALVEAGATRLGTSSSVALVHELRSASASS